MKSHLKSEASVPKVIKDAQKELCEIFDNLVMEFPSHKEVYKLLKDFAKKHQMKLSLIESYSTVVFFFSRTIGIELFWFELMILSERYMSLDLKRSF